MRKFSTALGLVAHAMFAVLGVIAIQMGGFWLGVALISYTISNVMRELLIQRQAIALAIAKPAPSRHGYGCPKDGEPMTEPCKECEEWERSLDV